MEIDEQNSLVREYAMFLKEEGKESRTIESYTADVKQFLQHVAQTSGHALEALAREDMISFRKAVLKRKLRPATVNKAVNSISCFCQWLKENGTLPGQRRVVEPRKDRVKVAYGSEQEVEVFTEEQLDRVLRHVEGHRATKRNRLIVHLLLYTGCRVSELVSIRLDDFDWRSGTLTLRGKGNKLRDVPLKEHLTRLVVDYEATKRTESPYLDSEYLLVSHRAPRLHRDSVNTMLEQLEKNAKFDFHLRPHKFRHTFCTLLISKGVPLTTVSKLAGHASIQTTATYYINTSRKEKEEAISLL